MGPSNIVLAIAANKCDLEDKREVRDEPLSQIIFWFFMKISYEQGQSYASDVNAIFAETSALTAKNVEEIFIEISKLS